MKAVNAFFPVLVVAILSAAAGLAMFFWLDSDRYSAQDLGSADMVLGKRRADFSLPDVNGHKQHVSQWDGKVLLVNFWATWCPPCREEIPDFIALQEEYGEQGLQIIGIALDDTDAVAKFAKAMGMNYPVLVQEGVSTKLVAAYGNPSGVLPFTAVVDREGIIRGAHRGLLHPEKAVQLFGPYLRGERNPS